MKLGNQNVVKGQPVFYLDTAKTSTIEGAATTVYAEGGRGNTRLIAWEGEKTLTFTVEDALLSPTSFAMLSGAGLVKGNENEEVHFHQTSNLIASSTDGSIDLSNALEPKETVDIDAPLFILEVDESGDLTGKMVSANYTLDDTKTKLVLKKVSNPELIISTVDQKNEDWSEVIQKPTDNTNTAADWRYALPLTSKQVLKITGDELKNYSADDYRIDTTTGEVFSRGTAKYPVTYKSFINFNALLKKNIDALYKLGDNVTIVPYNLSHLSINVSEFPSSKETDAVNYSIPTITIAVETDGTPTLLEEDSENLIDVLQDASLIKSSISSEALNALAAYFKDGPTAFAGTGNNKRELVTNFLIVQAALQYYYYSYVQEYTKPTAEDKSYNGLATNIPLLGLRSAKAVFSSTASNANTPQLYAKVDGSDTYRANENGEYLQGRGLAFYKGLETGSINTKAFKETAGKAVMVDYYVVKPADTVSELQIDAGSFAGYYYVEADTLFRRQIDGVDLPANITFPNVKIQSNFTFSMAPTGDPSTFTFTMDAMPGYTYFDKTKKVLCAIQIVDDKSKKAKEPKSIFTHPAGFGQIDASVNDSIPDRKSE